MEIEQIIKLIEERIVSLENLASLTKNPIYIYEISGMKKALKIINDNK